MKCLTSFPLLVLDNSVPRLLTPGAFVSPQYSDCLLKLFTISFFYKWLSCLEKGRLLLWISALRSSVKHSFDLSIIVLTKIYLHFCVHSSTLISSRIEVANYSGSISLIFVHLLSCSVWVLAFALSAENKILDIFFPHAADLPAFLNPSVVLFWSFLCLYYWLLLDLSAYFIPTACFIMNIFWNFQGLF